MTLPISKLVLNLDAPSRAVENPNESLLSSDSFALEFELLNSNIIALS